MDCSKWKKGRKKKPFCSFYFYNFFSLTLDEKQNHSQRMSNKSKRTKRPSLLFLTNPVKCTSYVARLSWILREYQNENLILLFKLISEISLKFFFFFCKKEINYCIVSSFLLVFDKKNLFLDCFSIHYSFDHPNTHRHLQFINKTGP